MHRNGFSRAVLWLAAMNLCIAMTSASQAEDFPDPNVKYTWFLPRTVIDVTLLYTYSDCEDHKGVSVHIKPTLVTRGVPDTEVGARTITSKELRSATNDTNVTIKTFAGSHILSSIGAQPVNQVAAIATNILTSIGKIAALYFGVPLTAAANEPPPPPTYKNCGSAHKDKMHIAEIQKNIPKFQDDIVKDTTSDDQRKSLASKIEAYQNVVTALTTQYAAHNVQIQLTIDPGFTRVKIDDPTVTLLPAWKHTNIDANGLIASIVPTKAQIIGAGWVDEKFELTEDMLNTFRVNIYLDFSKTLPTQRATFTSKRFPTIVEVGHIFRETAYIPVYVYAGARLADWGGSDEATFNQTGDEPTRIVTENGKLKNELLAPPQRLPFSQFGRPMGLPFTAKTFENLSWQLDFLENGEVTNATLVSKARGLAATNALNTALGTFNAIAAEKRAADAAPSSETVRLKAENDAIQAQISNINLQQQLQALLAKQSVPPRAAGNQQ